MRARAQWMCVGALTAAISGTSPRAEACDVGGFANATIDPALRATDPVAPSLPPPGPVTVHRGKGPERSGCSQSVTSCDDTGTVQIAVAATDDQTAAARIGYRVRVGGTPPAGLSVPAQPVEALAGLLFFSWSDDATDDQEAIDFSLELTAVDGAGNESPPQIVRIQHGGSGGGCGLTARRAGDAPWFLLAAVLIGVAVRRRRAF